MGWQTENEKSFWKLARDFLDREMRGAIGTCGKMYKSEARARAAMRRKGLRCTSTRVTTPCILHTHTDYQMHPERSPEHPIGKLTFAGLTGNHDDPNNSIIVMFRRRK